MALPQILTLAETAEYLGRPAKWVAEQARAGRLPGRRVGRQWRFLEADVVAYLDSVRTGGEIRRRRAS